MAKRPQDKRLSRSKQEARLRQIALTLQKRGLAFTRTDLTAKLSAKTKAIARKLEGIHTGTLKAYKLPQKSRWKYETETSQTSPSGTHIIAPPAGPDERKRIKRGMLSTMRPLGEGFHIEIIELPVNVANPNQLRAWIASGEPERLKHPQEYFAFRIEGHASHTAFPNVDALLDYLNTYDLMKKLSGDGGMPVAFELVRVWPPQYWLQVTARESETVRRHGKPRRISKRAQHNRRMRDSEKYARLKRQMANDPGFAAQTREQWRAKWAKRKAKKKAPK